MTGAVSRPGIAGGHPHSRGSRFPSSPGRHAGGYRRRPRRGDLWSPCRPRPAWRRLPSGSSCPMPLAWLRLPGTACIAPERSISPERAIISDERFVEVTPAGARAPDSGQGHVPGGARRAPARLGVTGPPKPGGPGAGQWTRAAGAAPSPQRSPMTPITCWSWDDPSTCWPRRAQSQRPGAGWQSSRERWRRSSASRWPD